MCVRSLAYTLSEPTQGINISLTSVKHVLTITYSVQSMYKQILSTYTPYNHFRYILKLYRINNMLITNPSNPDRKEK